MSVKRSIPTKYKKEKQKKIFGKILKQQPKIKLIKAKIRE